MTRKLTTAIFVLFVVDLAAGTQVIAIACGYEHSVALRADGTVIAWGAFRSPYA